MDFVVLHFTLFVLLASILTSAVCLSAYLVSRRQLFLLGAVGFFFYFFDVAWVFQDNIVGFGHMWHDQLYIAVRSIATIVSGVGFMSTFWLVICEYLGHSSLKMRVIPCLVFTAVSIIALIVPLPEDDNLARFIFYTPRAVFLAWMLLYTGARYVFTRDDFERKRIARAKLIYLVLWALGASMVIEDAAFFLGPNPTGFIMDLRAVAPERNYSENALLHARYVPQRAHKPFAEVRKPSAATNGATGKLCRGASAALRQAPQAFSARARSTAHGIGRHGQPEHRFGPLAFAQHG